MAGNGTHRGREGADSALVVALAAGSTTAEAAASVGVSQRTIARRTADPAFVRRVQSARAECLSRAVARLSAAGTTAVDTLVELLSPELPPSIRLGSAKAILDLGLKFRAEVEITDRVRKVEEHLGLGGGEWPL